MGETPSQPQIVLPDMCSKHKWLLIHQAGYREQNPWRALVIVAQLALFQAASCDQKTHERLEQMGGDITNVERLGCLACYKPDAFGEIVQAVQSGDLGAVKALGERWVSTAAEAAKGKQ